MLTDRKQMKKYKIDIYTLTESGNHSSNNIYYGSIVFETKSDASWVLTFYIMQADKWQ